MTTTLITGANKGLGYEASRRLLELGHIVYLGARDEERGRAAAQALGARFVLIDVTDDDSVARAVDRIRDDEGHLDVLVNNAGITGGRATADELGAEQMKTTFDTNVFGVVRVTRATLPLLRKSENPVIVNVSSGLGSLSIVTDPTRMEWSFPSLAYSASKAAVLMLTVQYAKALPELRINAVDPGYTATDLNGNSGTQTVREGTDAIIRLATIDRDGPTGTFQDRSGTVPW